MEVAGVPARGPSRCIVTKRAHASQFARVALGANSAERMNGTVTTENPPSQLSGVLVASAVPLEVLRIVPL